MTVWQRSRMAVAAVGIAVAGIAGSASVAGADYVDEANSIDEITEAVDYRTSDADTLRLYRAFLDREPDLPGAKYWISQTRSGASLDDLAYGFAQSDEFISEYGTLTNAEFLTLIYDNMLGRVADQAGYDYWLGEMNDGLLQFGVVRWVVANDEFVTNYPYSPRTPGNPGDTKNCGDFDTQAEAQVWFDHHYDDYGDVAKLDQDNNRVACESLP